MDFESNCRAADDESQKFENTPDTKSTITTNASIGCSTSDRIKSIGVSGKRIQIMELPI